MINNKLRRVAWWAGAARSCRNPKTGEWARASDEAYEIDFVQSVDPATVLALLDEIVDIRNTVLEEVAVSFSGVPVDRMCSMDVQNHIRKMKST